MHQKWFNTSIQHHFFYTAIARSTTIENNATKRNLYCQNEKLLQIKQEKRTLNKVTPQNFQMKYQYNLWNNSCNHKTFAIRKTSQILDFSLGL